MFANSLGGIFMAGVRVTICGVNTKDLPLLSAKDKKELLTKIKAGDNSAREAFIKGNLRLCLNINDCL